MHNFTRDKNETFLKRTVYFITNIIIGILIPVSLLAQDSTAIAANANQQYGILNDPDSLTGKAHKGFDDVSKLHRTFFGENYRKEWSVDTKLPVIRLSSFRGGLVPIRQGGGNQTLSLRLKDQEGNEWVIRSVEKYPEAILPKILKKTFVRDIVTDAMSAQHPYSALVVPPIANAVGVPHADHCGDRERVENPRGEKKQGSKFFERSRQREDAGNYEFEQNRAAGSSKSGMDFRRTSKKDAVARHGIWHARAGKNRGVQRAERRNHHRQRYPEGRIAP